MIRTTKLPVLFVMANRMLGGWAAASGMLEPLLRADPLATAATADTGDSTPAGDSWTPAG